MPRITLSLPTTLSTLAGVELKVPYPMTPEEFDDMVGFVLSLKDSLVEAPERPPSNEK